MGKYSGALGTAAQCHPLVGASVWAGIQGIMQVRIYYTTYPKPTYTDSVRR